MRPSRVPGGRPAGFRGSRSAPAPRIPASSASSRQSTPSPSRWSASGACSRSTACPEFVRAAGPTPRAAGVESRSPSASRRVIKLTSRSAWRPRRHLAGRRAQPVAAECVVGFRWADSCPRTSEVPPDLQNAVTLRARFGRFRASGSLTAGRDQPALSLGRCTPTFSWRAVLRGGWTSTPGWWQGTCILRPHHATTIAT